jgi:hypothetical protein
MTLLLLALLTGMLAAAPAAAARPAIGIGEQKPGMFADAHWQRLGLRDVRYVAPWDALRDPVQRELLDAWMKAARRSRARVLLGFAHSLRSARLARRLPTPRRYEREFVRFRARYPWVRDWLVWNEANHPFSLTAHRPRRAAAYFDAIARHCRRCRVVAADVLDVRGMSGWLRRFVRYARHRPRIWGLHNYVDANRFGSEGTRALLALTRGKVWFTETGGWVLRRAYRRRRIVREFRSSPRAAAAATRHVLQLACISRRVRRVYLYNWQAPRRVTTWDSGFVGPRGRVRPAYKVLRRQVRRAHGPFVRCGRGRYTATPLMKSTRSAATRSGSSQWNAWPPPP